MATRNQLGTTIDAGTVIRITGGPLEGFESSRTAWFGPLEPLPPVTPANQLESVAGRALDYPVGYNLRLQPRSGETVSFAEMRGLADSYDLLRLVIETRKDQMAKLRWKIKPKDDKKKPDSRCEAIADFLSSPDREHTWDEWLRLLLEDLLVLDAPCLFVRNTKGGGLYGFEALDGATVKRVIDEHGRTPLPPEPAYQQILKGVPAINYTREELIYKPRNIRTNRVYGYSPVEQVIMTVNIALRRQLHQLQYYTDGSTPDLILEVPESWTVDQIKEFRKWWNSVLQGDTAERRGTMFVPKGTKPVNTKEMALKDEYDEWLARVVCYAFSVSPQPFIKEVNRATAQTSVEQALQEGLQPLMQWVNGLLDFLVAKYFKAPDLEFAWDTEKELDPKDRAEIHRMYVEAKVLTPDEVRIDLGRDPMTPEDREAAWPAPAPLTPPDEGAGDPADKPKPGKKAPPTEKLAKIVKIKPIKRERETVTAARASLEKACILAFSAMAETVAEQIAGALGKGDQSEVDRIMAAIDVSGLAVLSGDFEAVYAEIAKDGAITALAQIGIDDAKIVDLVNKWAVSWAEDRAAEMVGKRRLKDGTLIDNPNARWVITETTRDMINSQVSQAIKEGWSNDTLAQAIRESHAFSIERAENIARTETAFADVEGNMTAYRESGIVHKKEWLTADGCCELCAAINGKVVDIDKPFVDDVMQPPYHPRCRCDILPVIDEE